MKKVAVVMGGYSDEYAVSIKSGELIYQSIDKSLYQVFKVHIHIDGWYVWHQEQKIAIDKKDFGFEWNGQKVNFDVVFNIVHGTPGEDGYLQAYWDVVGQKYTGCGHYLSALTFNKKDTIAVLQKYDIPAAVSYYVSKGEAYDAQQIVDKVGLPCFVKPNQAGSSLGISKVKEIAEFDQALEKAFVEDDEVLIESFLDGTEVSVGVIEYQGQVCITGITEIVSHNDFFDYEAKYQGASEEITPARLTDEVKQKVEEIAVKVYKSLRMKGMSRSEYIIVNGIPHFIEMNTLPGFSPASILPQQLAYSGISISDFVHSELEKALA